MRRNEMNAGALSKMFHNKILSSILIVALVFSCQAPLRVSAAENVHGGILGGQTQPEETEQGEDLNVRSVLNDSGSTGGVFTTIPNILGNASGTKDAENGNDDGKSKEDMPKTTMQALLPQMAGAAVLLADRSAEEYLQAVEDAEGASWGYTNLGIANVEDNLNIRSIPQEDGKLLGKLPKNAACEILDETEDGWAHIMSGEVEGYVKAEYLLVGYQAKRRVREFLTTNAVVLTDGLNVRERPDTDAEIITQVAEGEELEFIEEQGEWTKIYLDDQEVYVASEYVEVREELATAITMTEVLYGAGVSDIRASICQYGMQFLGNPYVWGGTSLTKGADCSGFTMSVFKNFGIKLPHSSVAQAKMGTTINIGEAKPGDLIFYGNGKRINHVAIYIGNGMVVHASNPRTGIRTSGVRYRTPVKAVRILYD